MAEIFQSPVRKVIERQRDIVEERFRVGLDRGLVGVEVNAVKVVVLSGLEGVLHRDEVVLRRQRFRVSARKRVSRPVALTMMPRANAIQAREMRAVPGIQVISCLPCRKIVARIDGSPAAIEAAPSGSYIFCPPTRLDLDQTTMSAASDCCRLLPEAHACRAPATGSGGSTPPPAAACLPRPANRGRRALRIDALRRRRLRGCMRLGG